MPSPALPGSDLLAPTRSREEPGSSAAPPIQEPGAEPTSAAPLDPPGPAAPAPVAAPTSLGASAEPRHEAQGQPRPEAIAPPAHLPAAAVLIDFENVLYGLSNRFGAQRAAELVCIGELLNLVRERLWPSVRRAYGDFRSRELGAWQGELYRQGFEVVPVLSRHGNGLRKNASDIRLAVDAIELALTSPHIETFVIVSGDRDMVEIVRCLQRHGKRVWCVAPEASASSDLTGVCDVFLPYARVHELARGLVAASDRAAAPERTAYPGAGPMAAGATGPTASNGSAAIHGTSPHHPATLASHTPSGTPFPGAASAVSQAAPHAGNGHSSGNGHGPRAAHRELPMPPSAQSAPAAPLAPHLVAQAELLHETEVVRTGFEPDCERRRERLLRWFEFARTRERFTLAEVFDALAEGLASNRSALAKLFTMLYQGRAFELDNYDPAVPFRERALRFSPEVRSAEDLVRLHERSALQRLLQADPAMANATNARVLLGLDESEAAYAEALLEELRARAEGERPGAAAAPRSYSGIEPGQRRRGIVKKVADYGAVVSLDGIDGLLHVSDISWGRIEHTSQALAPNQEIEVLVLDVDSARGRVNLGLKQLTPSPWADAEQRYPIGSEHEGAIIALKHYGAFVDLETGITGLVHNSEISWARHVHHPSELLEQGQRVRVMVQELDKEKRRIALSIRATQPNPWEFAELGYPVGSVVEGRVTYLAGYGAFVELERGLQGLLHVSELSWTRQPAHPGEVLTVGEPVRCRVLSVDARAGRMALGLKQLHPDPFEHGLETRYAVGSEHEGVVLRRGPEETSALLDGEVEVHGPATTPGIDLEEGDRVRLRLVQFDGETRRIGAEFLHADFPENRARRAAASDNLDALRAELAALLEERAGEPWLGSKLKEELARRHGTRFDEQSFGAPTFARLLEMVPEVARVERRAGADILVHRV
ncbi:MAG: S1 RNA-binding domain-containing protein [Planctomycetaceae bacterium]|nr:S1 RNA-binding domain-containing protein [Planctomycetaceae bacterium]